MRSRTIGFEWIAQRVARRGVLQADQRNDITGVTLFDFFAVVGVHQQHPADTLFFIL
jgi:hypothetical protein